MVGVARTQASAPKLTETVVPVLLTDTGVMVTPAFGSEKLWPTIDLAPGSPSPDAFGHVFAVLAPASLPHAVAS